MPHKGKAAAVTSEVICPLAIGRESADRAPSGGKEWSHPGRGGRKTSAGMGVWCSGDRTAWREGLWRWSMHPASSQSAPLGNVSGMCRGGRGAPCELAQGAGWWHINGKGLVALAGHQTWVREGVRGGGFINPLGWLVILRVCSSPLTQRGGVTRGGLRGCRCVFLGRFRTCLRIRLQPGVGSLC